MTCGVNMQNIFFIIIINVTDLRDIRLVIKTVNSTDPETKHYNNSQLLFTFTSNSIKVPAAKSFYCIKDKHIANRGQNLSFKIGGGVTALKTESLKVPVNRLRSLN